MRIISGALKGRSIKFLKNDTTRPLKDSVKESIFNILKHSPQFTTRVENSNVLDLYSGVGSFGIECVSRGAKKVSFVEQDFKAASVLKENLKNLSIERNTKVYQEKIENLSKKLNNEKFNIFFFDPPFDNTNFVETLKLLKKFKIYEKDI